MTVLIPESCLLLSLMSMHSLFCAGMHTLTLSSLAAEGFLVWVRRNLLILFTLSCIITSTHS